MKAFAHAAQREGPDGFRHCPTLRNARHLVLGGLNSAAAHGSQLGPGVADPQPELPRGEFVLFGHGVTVAIALIEIGGASGHHRRRDTGAVSQANVEIIRRAFEDFLRTGDPHLELLDPTAAVHDHDIPDAGTYVGPDGYMRWLADWSKAWDEFRIEPERWIDGGDKVVLLLVMTAKGRRSGAEVTRRDAMVWTMRDGRAVTIDYYNDQPEALEAAGLSTS
jgi:ketosteroid isomerase-like protein